MLRLKLKRCLPAALLLLALSVIGLPLAAQKPAAHKPIKIDATKLEGVPNFRDIGGYKTSDGHTIRYNTIYRSAQLTAMTPDDNALLAPLKIRYEIDLRTPGQISQAPTHWGPNPPQAIDIPFLPHSPPPLLPPNNLDPAQVKAQWRQNYAITAVVNAQTIGKVLHDLAQGDEPVLIHCTVGRDRTGQTIAVLMTLLGVSRKDVYREFLLSNEYLLADGKYSTEAQRRLIATAMNLPYPPAPVDPKLQKANSGDASWLDAFFLSIDRKYGSFDAYVRDGLKLSKEDVQSLRRRLLVN
jgi:protein-tyrosine phosphatase